MSPTDFFVCAVTFVIIGSNALSTSTTTTVVPSSPPSPSSPSTTAKSEAVQDIEKRIDEAEALHRIQVALRIRNTLKNVKQITQPNGLIEKAVQTNFLHSLYQMANNSAITGTNVSRAAGTLIRGFVQVSISAYFPRLIFLDGPTQFIETLRLLRANQIRAPMNMNEAIDTLINFASVARESQIFMNVGTPFLSIWPNIFRGAELLSTEVLYSVFQWLGPISPSDISSHAVEGLWNRWDIKASTTSRYDYDKKWQQSPNSQPDTINGRPLYETEKVVKTP